MLIYEKNNKLNINFENELDNPDIEIGKGEINVDGNNIVNGGSRSEPLVVTFSGTTEDENAACDKTWAEISSAFNAGTPISAYYFYEHKTIEISVSLEADEFEGEVTLFGLEAHGIASVNIDGGSGIISSIQFVACTINDDETPIIGLNSVLIN